MEKRPPPRGGAPPGLLVSSSSAVSWICADETAAMSEIKEETRGKECEKSSGFSGAGAGGDDSPRAPRSKAQHFDANALSHHFSTHGIPPQRT